MDYLIAQIMMMSGAFVAGVALGLFMARCVVELTRRRKK